MNIVKMVGFDNNKLSKIRKFTYSILAAEFDYF